MVLAVLGVGLVGNFGKAAEVGKVLSVEKVAGRVKDQHWLCNRVAEEHTADEDVVMADIGTWD